MGQHGVHDAGMHDRSSRKGLKIATASELSLRGDGLAINTWFTPLCWLEGRTREQGSGVEMRRSQIYPALSYHSLALDEPTSVLIKSSQPTVDYSSCSCERCITSYLIKLRFFLSARVSFELGTRFILLGLTNLEINIFSIA